MNTPEKTQQTKHRHSNSLKMNKNAVSVRVKVTQLLTVFFIK